MTTDNKNITKDENSTSNKKTKKIKSNKMKSKIKIVFKTLIIIIIMLILLVFASMQTTTYKTLKNGGWANDVGTISFGDMFHFAFYNGGSGSPVGDADLYPYYIYFGNKSFITLGGFSIKTGKIHHIDDRCMILTYDNETFLFCNYNAFEEGDDRLEFNINATCEECYKTATDDDVVSYEYCNVADINDKSITVSFFEFYNKKENKAYTYDFDIQDDVNFDYSKQVSELIDEYNMHTHKCKSKDITKKEAISLLKDKSNKAYVGFNKEGKISDIIVMDAKHTMLELSTMERTKIEREITKREEEAMEEKLYPEGEKR